MALSAARNTQVLGPGGVPILTSYPMKSGATIYKGGIVVLESTGYAKAGVSGTSLITVGIAQATLTNAGADGALQIPVNQCVAAMEQNGTAFSVADTGSLCYVFDDATMTKNSSSRSIAGTVYFVDDAGKVWVYMGLAASVDGTALAAVASDLAQLEVDLAATTNGEGASMIGVEDAGSLLTATTVEAALAEIAADIVGIGSAPQALTGAGALSVTTMVTLFTSSGGSQALTLANGTQTGQLKLVIHTVDGGSGVITPASAGNFATVTLTNRYEACLFQWSGAAWNVVLPSPVAIVTP
jgi:hypothetical protein